MQVMDNDNINNNNNNNNNLGFRVLRTGWEDPTVGAGRARAGMRRGTTPWTTGGGGTGTTAGTAGTLGTGGAASLTASGQRTGMAGQTGGWYLSNPAQYTHALAQEEYPL